jgi:hypothetical protein
VIFRSRGGNRRKTRVMRDGMWVLLVRPHREKSGYGTALARCAPGVGFRSSAGAEEKGARLQCRCRLIENGWLKLIAIGTVSSKILVEALAARDKQY